ncbi:MAG TPA: phosphodiesterase [Synergistaceae bacterium]|nr:phosphodiesterase [Synergistaceae bacterium]HQF92292.1 phosphodiesterase [Synergistaceae bacterium]HQH79543.1 phosphodiesterase [Synergistaceae bacterium]HQK26011.1 phosphodiesterase [Synergistaceae bacterium]
MTTRLGIVSDTHGSLTAWENAQKLWGPVEGVLHAGDVFYARADRPLPPGFAPDELAAALNACPVPLLLARGNCDSPADEGKLRWPLGAVVSAWWRGRLILVEHGEDFSAFRERALGCGAALAISGHTHVASLVREGGTIFLNPGSASLPLGRDPASVALVDEEELTIVTLSGVVLHREPWG